MADQYSDPNAWNSDEHFPIKLALALAAARSMMRSPRPSAPRKDQQNTKEEVGARRACDAPETYSDDVLFPIPRTRGDACWAGGWGAPFRSPPVWNCYEAAARPSRTAAARRRGAEDPVRVAERLESKSLKLYAVNSELQAVCVDGRRARDDKTGRGVRRGLPRER